MAAERPRARTTIKDSQTTMDDDATALDYAIRRAGPADAAALFELIKGLAEYEKLSHAVTGSAAELAQHLDGERPYVEALLAESADGAPVGMALFFSTYSTFLTRPGLYLEDIFVRPEHRGGGIGRALLTEVARLAHQRGCGRLEWTVLDWNAPAIGFYEGMGAKVLPDWRVCRLSGEALAKLAEAGE